MKLNKSLKVLAVSLIAAGSFGLAQANSEISMEQATAIALAKVPGANATHVYKVHPDIENGRKVYEGKSSTMALNTNSKSMLLPVRLLNGM